MVSNLWTWSSYCFCMTHHDFDIVYFEEEGRLGAQADHHCGLDPDAGFLRIERHGRRSAWWWRPEGRAARHGRQESKSRAAELAGAELQGRQRADEALGQGEGQRQDPRHRRAQDRRCCAGRVQAVRAEERPAPDHQWPGPRSAEQAHRADGGAQGRVPAALRPAHGG